ncbi:ATP-binding protein [Syntrophomonas wolfei]|nr:ATP-binding protein [Syntrophomonas wolfei]
MECRCTPLQIQRYLGRVSGPLLDRMIFPSGIIATIIIYLTDVLGSKTMGTTNPLLVLNIK